MSRNWSGNSRSIRAPLGTRPAVGTPWATSAASPSALEAGDGNRALGHRIDLPVPAHQRRHHQRAAHHGAGIPEG